MSSTDALAATMSGVALETGDVQGLVVSGYGHHPAAAYLLGRVDDPAAARRWLAGLVVTGAEGPDPASSTNVALTAAGLRRLGVADADLATFSLAFRQGALSRAGRLGDAGPNDPAGWRWGGPGAEVDVVLCCYAPDPDGLRRLVGRHRSDAAGAVDLGTALVTRAEQIDREPFGFVDGIGQPERPAPPPHRGRWPDPVDAFVVGPGAGGVPVPSLAGTPWGCNGTYLVLRELEQDVVAFHDHLDELVAASPEAQHEELRELAAAKMMGRWPDGRPLVRWPERPTTPVDPDDDRDAFSYGADPHGLRCPVGAHIRRANPRDDDGRGPGSLLSADRHRILRRGRPFGAAPASGVTRPAAAGTVPSGMFFVGLCADLEQQFEFVQRAWCLSPSFRGLPSETDPVIGWRDDGSRRFSVPGRPVTRQRRLPNLVTTRGSLYAFVPGRAALAALPTLLA